MATSINIELGYKDAAWFAANPTKVLLAGQIVYLQQTGTYKIGDGTTTLSALTFLGGTSSTPTIQQVLTAGSTATTTITTTGFIKTAGTSAQFLKADGSVDSSTYLTTLGTAATSITTTGTSGASTLIANVLNVPNYTLAGLGGTTLAAVNAQNLSVFAATTSLQLAGVISDETGSGALVFGTSPTFTTNITTPEIIGSSASSGTLTLQSTSNATKGKILFGTSAYDEVNNRLGLGISSPVYDFDLIKSVPASYVGANVQNTSATGYSVIEVLGNNNTTYASLNVFNTAGGVGTFYDNNTAGVATNSPTLSFLTNESATGGWVLTAGGYGTGSEKARFTINATSFKQAVATSGAITNFTFTTSNNTNQTLSTNISNFKVTGSTKQWATGALATQYFNYFTNNTIAFVGASTATDSYNTYIESVVAGTNATLTRKYSLGTSDNVAFGISNSAATLHLGVTPSASNYMLSNAAGAGSTYLNAPNAGFIVLSIGGGNKFQINNSSITFSPNIATTTNATVCYTFSFSSNSNQTLSTEISGVLYNNYSRNWATGNITIQREQYIKTATYTALGASVITNAYGFYVEAPTASTNITITNNFALGLAGSLKINDGFNIVFDTTTGTKHGTATTQKLSFWNATPIIQPTTAVAAATIVSPGAGNVIKTDDTFDGYTLQQIVKALRNTGLLA